jgi:membrane-bound serine protease (ClpP class)
MLIDTDVPGYGVPLSLIVVLALVSVAFVVTVVRMAVRARRRPVVTGLHSMIGADGEMLEDAAGTGWASINGETWQVRVDTPLAKGRRIRVVGMNGNVPIVEQAEERVP